MGYALTLKRNNNNDPFIRDNATDTPKRVIKDIGWYIPHFTPSLESQQIMMHRLLNKDPTDFYYMERNVFRKYVNTYKIWTFDLGKNGKSTPTFVRFGFQARNKID